MSVDAASTLLMQEPPSVDTNRVLLEHLDYGYIQTCADPKYLGEILTVLRSGKEGMYPHLTEFCEKRLEKLDPKSRALRKENSPATAASFSKDEWKEITDDLQTWQEEIKVSEEELKQQPLFCDFENVPPVRSSNLSVLKGSGDTGAKKQVRKSPLPRAYEDWDKFSVEEECAKIDESLPHNECPTNIDHNFAKIKSKIDTTALSAQEKTLLANRERDKGNEAFRAGDYEEAVAYYSRSVCMMPMAVTYNNRAQAHITLQRWDEALSDCDSTLLWEPLNAKALLRRATVHKQLGNLQMAHDDITTVLQSEPNNMSAQKLLKEVTMTTNTDEQETPHKGKKLFIKEVEEEEDDDEDNRTMSDGGQRAGEDSNTERDNKLHGQKTGEEERKGLADMYKLQVEGETGAVEDRQVLADSSSELDSTKGGREDLDMETGSHPPFLLRVDDEGHQLLTRDQCADAEEEYTQSVPDAGERSEARFSSLKQEGNELVKMGQYLEAVEKYSQCLRLKPHECAIYTNRALCFIKLERFAEAKQDCNSALKLQPSNKKAFYRRALASKGLQDYVACTTDLEEVLRLDASVYEAERELAEVMALLKEKRTTGSPSWPRRSIVITEEDEEEEEEEDEGAVAGSDEEQKSGRIINLHPSNAHEFGHMLNVAYTHRDAAACAHLLCSVPPQSLPPYINTFLDSHTFSFIIHALDTHLLPTQPGLVFQILSHLHSTERFSLVLMLLNSDEKRQVTQLFEALCSVESEEFSQDSVNDLACKYI